VSLDAPVSVVLERKVGTQYPRPVTAQVGAEREELLALMRQHVLRQIPILNGEGRVVDLVLLNDLITTNELPLQAVIMAGGLGMRLRPLTEDLPKPMLLVGGKPLMERVIEQLRQVGIQRVNVMTHYKSEKIVDYFGDGQAFGVELNYVNEDHPLGTGGALGLMPQPQEPLLVINGDILTQVDFGAMLAFHQENHALMTIAVRRYEVQVPYGVIECEGSRVRRLSEKPHLEFLVNAGIYLLEPAVFDSIPQGQHFNMTDLIQWQLDADGVVASFPIHEYWLDIGQHADYARAQEDIKQDERLQTKNASSPME
jgi:NDP-sugar pyrophosphorylase family protein